MCGCSRMRGGRGTREGTEDAPPSVSARAGMQRLGCSVQHSRQTSGYRRRSQSGLGHEYWCSRGRAR